MGKEISSTLPNTSSTLPPPKNPPPVFVLRGPNPFLEEWSNCHVSDPMVESRSPNGSLAECVLFLSCQFWVCSPSSGSQMIPVRRPTETMGPAIPGTEDMGKHRLLLTIYINYVYSILFSADCSSRGGRNEGSCAGGFGVCCFCKYLTIHIINVFIKMRNSRVWVRPYDLWERHLLREPRQQRPAHLQPHGQQAQRRHLSGECLIRLIKHHEKV